MAKTGGKFVSRMRFRQTSDHPWFFKFPNTHRLFEPFNQKIQELVEAGIVNLHFSYDLKYNNLKRYNYLVFDEPQVLTMKQLEAGFVIWIICLSLSPVAFLMEWLVQGTQYLKVKHYLEAFFKLN